MSAHASGNTTKRRTVCMMRSSKNGQPSVRCPISFGCKVYMAMMSTKASEMSVIKADSVTLDNATWLATTSDACSRHNCRKVCWRQTNKPKTCTRTTEVLRAPAVVAVNANIP